MRISKPGHAIGCLVVVAGFLFLAGCGGRAAMPVRSNFVEFTPEQKLRMASDAGRPYRIQASDVLRIAVSNQKELSTDGVLVLSDGAISLVGTGRLPVAGLTLAGADSLITAAYSHEIRDPDVSVVIVETKGKQVYILGEVRAPGMRRLPSGGLGIIGAITLAGGFTADAAPEGTVLVRITGDGYLAQEIDLSYFHDVEAMSIAAVGLQAFDVVYVPRSRAGDFSYFSRNVLQGLANMARMASDLKFLSSGTVRGF